MKETEAMLTIVERLRDAALFYRSNRPSVDHEKRVPRTQEITERECDEIAEREEAAIAEILRLQSELNTALERVKVLEDELQKIMIGGNHLGLIIGADHPVYTASFNDAREYYLNLGRNEEYEAWCCWKNIMEARDILQSSGGK